MSEEKYENFEVVAQLAGQFPGDETVGDIFGGSLVLNKNNLFIGAVFSTVNKMPRAGASYFFKPNDEATVKNKLFKLLKSEFRIVIT